MSTARIETAHRHAAVTASDTADISLIDGRTCRALRIGGAGNVVVVDQGGTAVTYTCVAGEVLLIEARRVNSTNTTATGIVAWF